MKSPVRDTQTWSHAQWLCHLGKVPYTLSFSLFFPKVATQPSTARHCYGHAYGTISGVPGKAWPGQAHSQGSCPALGLHAGSSRGPGPCLPVLKMALSRHPMPPEFSVVLFPFRPPLAFARKTDHRDVRCHPTPLALETLPWGTGGGGGAGAGGRGPPNLGQAFTCVHSTFFSPWCHRAAGGKSAVFCRRRNCSSMNLRNSPRSHSKNCLPPDCVPGTINQGEKAGIKAIQRRPVLGLPVFHLLRLQACGKTTRFASRGCCENG